MNLKNSLKYYSIKLEKNHQTENSNRKVNSEDGRSKLK